MRQPIFLKRQMLDLSWDVGVSFDGTMPKDKFWIPCETKSKAEELIEIIEERDKELIKHFITEKSDFCPKCFSNDITKGYLESVRGYGAGPGFIDCWDCNERSYDV